MPQKKVFINFLNHVIGRNYSYELLKLKLEKKLIAMNFLTIWEGPHSYERLGRCFKKKS